MTLRCPRGFVAAKPRKWPWPPASSSPVRTIKTKNQVQIRPFYVIVSKELLGAPLFAFLSRKPSPAVLERLAELEATQNVLELQMDELKALYRRAIARIKADNQEGAERAEAVPPEPAVESATEGRPRGLLSPRQREIQQTILRRRAGG